MKKVTESQMRFEAMESADAVEKQYRDCGGVVEAVASNLRDQAPSMVVTCARGSSDHAATFAKYLFETQLGWVTASAAPSVNSVYRSPLRLANSLMLAISQSGASPDLLSSVEHAAAQGARTLAMVNAPDSLLSFRADWTIPLSAGPEMSVAATKSYITSLSALAWLVAAIKDGTADNALIAGLPDLLRRARSLDWSPLVNALVEARGMFIIGRGPALGIAQEAALKLKETSGLHAEAFSAAEVKHGPIALAATGIPMLFFRQNDASGPGVDALAAEMAAMGVRTFVAGADIAGATTLPTVTADPVMESILQIQSFYIAASQLALARGLNPDDPPLLKKVTETV